MLLANRFGPATVRIDWTPAYTDGSISAVLTARLAPC